MNSHASDICNCNRWYTTSRNLAVAACAAFANLLVGSAWAEPNSLSEQQQVVKKLQAMLEARLRDSIPIDVKVLNDADIALAKTTEALFVDGDFKNSADGLIRRANVRNLLADEREIGRASCRERVCLAV